MWTYTDDYILEHGADLTKGNSKHKDIVTGLEDFADDLKRSVGWET